MAHIGSSCVFCAAPVTGKGEHVLPSWMYPRWPTTDGPYPIMVGGVPITSRAGNPPAEMMRVQLAVCGSNQNDCNGKLNMQFERPGRALVNNLIDDLGSVGGKDAENVARWFAKTLLLWGHPDTVVTVDGRAIPRETASCLQIPAHELRGLLAGRLPDDVSLWYAVVDPGITRPTQSLGTIILPSITISDGSGCVVSVRTAALGLNILKTRKMLLLQLLHHPMMDFEHPGVVAGLLSRIWPHPPASIDLSLGPNIGESEARAIGQVFVLDSLTSHVTTGRRRLDLNDLFRSLGIV